MDVQIRGITENIPIVNGLTWTAHIGFLFLSFFYLNHCQWSIESVTQLLVKDQKVDRDEYNPEKQKNFKDQQVKLIFYSKVRVRAFHVAVIPIRELSRAAVPKAKTQFFTDMPPQWQLLKDDYTCNTCDRTDQRPLLN